MVVRAEAVSGVNAHLEVVADGRVQGVGYRYHTAQWARELGVTGWVRNEPDGRVRAVLQHDDLQVLAQLADLLRQGPAHAWVLNLEVTPLESADAERFTSFEIRR